MSEREKQRGRELKTLAGLVYEMMEGGGEGIRVILGDYDPELDTRQTAGLVRAAGLLSTLRWLNETKD